MSSYDIGFAEKCAEYGVDPDILVKKAIAMNVVTRFLGRLGGTARGIAGAAGTSAMKGVRMLPGKAGRLVSEEALMRHIGKTAKNNRFNSMLYGKGGNRFNNLKAMRDHNTNNVLLGSGLLGGGIAAGAAAADGD